MQTLLPVFSLISDSFYECLCEFKCLTVIILVKYFSVKFSVPAFLAGRCALLQLSKWPWHQKYRIIAVIFYLLPECVSKNKFACFFFFFAFDVNKTTRNTRMDHIRILLWKSVWHIIGEIEGVCITAEHYARYKYMWSIIHAMKIST